MLQVKLGSVFAIAVLLAGCGTTRVASVGGECEAFLPPTQIVTGADRYSQGWVDETVETGVAACGWKRPHGRE